MSIIIGRAMGPMGGGGTDGWVPEFDLWDDFTTTEAAPLASPRTCEPGPGTWTVTDPNERISISSGNLLIAPEETANIGLASVENTFVAGLALLAYINSVTTAFQIGWGTVGALFSGGTMEFGTTGLAGIRSPGSALSGVTETLTWPQRVAIVRTASGKNLYIANDKLLFVSATTSTSNVSGVLRTTAASASSIGKSGLVPLPAPFNSDYGLATNRIAGAVSAGATFTHEANCLIEFTVTTLPSSGSTVVNFRVQDSSNYWYVIISLAGTLRLFEVVAGVATQRAEALTVVSSGHRIVIIADGTTIRGYSNNVLRWTYSSAANFKTETDGSLATLGTGGAVSDIVAWPRTLSGQAKTLLDAAIDA